MGEWVLALAERFPGMEVTGIDSSQEVITFARYLAETCKLTLARFQVMDARALLSPLLGYHHARMMKRDRGRREKRKPNSKPLVAHRSQVLTIRGTPSQS